MEQQLGTFAQEAVVDLVKNNGHSVTPTSSWPSIGKALAFLFTVELGHLHTAHSHNNSEWPCATGTVACFL